MGNDAGAVTKTGQDLRRRKTSAVQLGWGAWKFGKTGYERLDSSVLAFATRFEAEHTETSTVPKPLSRLKSPAPIKDKFIPIYIWWCQPDR